LVPKSSDYNPNDLSYMTLTMKLLFSCISAALAFGRLDSSPRYSPRVAAIHAPPGIVITPGVEKARTHPLQLFQGCVVCWSRCFDICTRLKATGEPIIALAGAFRRTMRERW